MSTLLDFIHGASLPASALAALGDLRRATGLEVINMGDRAWLRWESADETLALRLMAMVGVALYDKRDGLWYPHGGRLPAFGAPLDSAEAIAIHRAIVPLPVQPWPPAADPRTPARLGLVRDSRIQPASALRCALDALARWTDKATTLRLERLSAAVVGDVVMVLGANLPEMVAGERFCGKRILVPLGWRPDPDLSELAIRDALRIGDDEIGVLTSAGEACCEVVPRAAFKPLTRAGVRLARTRGTP